MANRELGDMTQTVGVLESDYLMLLEKSIDAIIVVGQDRTILFANPAADAILGGKEGEIPGESFHFPLDTGETTEITITHSDGEAVVTEMRVVETEWRGENAYLVSLRDITDRKRAEKAFKESEGRYKTLTGNLNVGVYRNTSGPKGRFIEVNPAHFKMFGCESKEEFLAGDVADLYQNPEDRKKLSEKLSSLGSVKEELHLRKRDGTAFIGLVSAVAVKDEDGEVRYFDGIIEDITERKRAENLLKDSEKRYRNLVEMAPVGIVALDMKGMVTSCNPAGLNLAGRSRDEVVGKHFTKTGTIRAEDAAEYTGVFSSVLGGKGHAPVEYTFNCKDGTIGWGEAHFGLLEDDSEPVGVQVILRDITERKRTEEFTRIQRDLGLAISAADSLDETMRLCFEAAIKVAGMDGGGIYLVDRDSGELNLAFHKGLSPEFAQHVSHYDASSINARLIMEGKPIYTRYDEMGIPLNEIDKREQIRLVATVPVLYEGQVIACLVISSHILDDIPSTTRNALEAIASQIGSSIARVQAEEALRESEKKYRLLTENSNASISIISRDGTFLLLNNVSAAEMAGKPDDFIGRSLHDILPTKLVNGAMKLIHEVIESGKGQTKENLVKMPIGDKWISSNIQPIIEPDGSISSVQVVSQDITKYKQTEEKLLQSRERENQAFAQGRLEIVDTILHNIGNAINSVTIGTGTIQRKVDRLTDYFSSLADAIAEHQDNFGDYVENDPQGQKVAPFIIALADEFRESNGLVERVNRVAGQAAHVADIIRTVKEVSGKPYRKDIDLKKAVDSAITVMQDSIEGRGIEISYDCSSAPAEISTHESQFHQMLVNLVKNSMEAIDDLRELGDTNNVYFIKITCRTKADSLILEVTDNGIGIDKDMLEIIFRSGYTTKSLGTGLGLHSIGNFVKGCDGSIQALSDGLGKGATIRVALPLSEE